MFCSLWLSLEAWGVTYSLSFGEGKDEGHGDAVRFVLVCRPDLRFSFGLERIKAVAMMKEKTNAVSPK